MSLKEMKKNLIIEAALNLFLEKNISIVTIKDIANNVEVGEATIYRYFECKENIVLLCAELLEKKVYEYFDLSKYDSGYKKIEGFYNNYLNIFNIHIEYYRFINEFDAFMIGKTNVDLEEYASLIDKFKNVFMLAYKEGLADNTIKEIDDIDVLYYSTSKALLELCKKESIGVDIVRQDKIIDKNKLIQKLIDIILITFKKEEA